MNGRRPAAGGAVRIDGGDGGATSVALCTADGGVWVAWTSADQVWATHASDGAAFDAPVRVDAGPAPRDL